MRSLHKRGRKKATLLRNSCLNTSSIWENPFSNRIVMRNGQKKTHSFFVVSQHNANVLLVHQHLPIIFFGSRILPSLRIRVAIDQNNVPCNFFIRALYSFCL